MHFQEIDFRRNWLSQLYVALTAMLSDIYRRLKQDEYYDGSDAREDAESILGIAFIAAQMYIEGTYADINAILGKAKAVPKQDLLALDVQFVTGKVTRLELIWAIANYQKHHDTWDGWKVNDQNKKTILALNACSINENTSNPCYTVATMLWPEQQLGELRYLLALLVDWRDRVFRKYRPDDNAKVIHQMA